jgi:hypothetical protein
MRRSITPTLSKNPLNSRPSTVSANYLDKVRSHTPKRIFETSQKKPKEVKTLIKTKSAIYSSQMDSQKPPSSTKPFHKDKIKIPLDYFLGTAKVIKQQ